jgi:hypothetical protein
MSITAAYVERKEKASHVVRGVKQSMPVQGDAHRGNKKRREYK